MRRLTLLLVVLGLALLAGCGIPVDRAAHSFVVVQASPTPTSPGPAHEISVYFVQNKKLVAVRRDISATSAAAAQETLVQLLAGPTVQEKATGITTSIPSTAAITVTNPPVHGVIDVALDTNFLGIELGPLLFQAYGQVVYTLTGADLGITKVQFLVGTQKWALVFEPSPIATGPSSTSGATVVSGLVSRSNYCKIAFSGCAGILPPPRQSDSSP
jgi:hypothetical protein